MNANVSDSAVGLAACGGHPLYTFNGYHLGNAPDAPADTKPGDIHGQGYVSAWWVLSPAGKAITTQPSASG